MPSLHGSGTGEETPCRSCTSFSEYMKTSKKKYFAELGHEKDVKKPLITGTNCPLDRDDLGRNTWSFLHTMAARYPRSPSSEQQTDMKQFIHLFTKFYPCDTCAEDFQKDMKATPPQTNSQEALSQWLCQMHNKVNIKLGKPSFNCAKVNERWRDGWLDGSCG